MRGPLPVPARSGPFPQLANLYLSDLPTPSAQYLTGLIGRGILKSRSPWLHEQEGQAQGRPNRSSVPQM